MNKTPDVTRIHSVLASILDDDSLLTDNDVAHYSHDRTALPGNASAVALPRNIEQLQTIVRCANQHRFPLVPSGGRTGLSGGACATRGEVVVALDRMNRILEVDTVDRMVRCEAGVVTAQLHELAQQHNLFFPVDFASSGSSQIGGNVATNAGGNRVIRYGMFRHWVLGLNVICGNGELLHFNKLLKKNNTGYDLQQLFIGSEGTLGIIYEVTLQLTSPPQSTVALFSFEGFSQALAFAQQAQQHFDVLALECFSRRAFSYVSKHARLREPFIIGEQDRYFLLLECNSRTPEQLAPLISATQPVNAIVANSLQQASELWRYRENISEAIAPHQPLKLDISVRPSRLDEFYQRLNALLSQQYPDWELVLFGHLGDGNLHVNLLNDTLSGEQQKATLEQAIYLLVAEYDGSISAEHGVGLTKKPFLGINRSEEEIALFRQIKAIFDPNHIMNPGKIFDDV